MSIGGIKKPKPWRSTKMGGNEIEFTQEGEEWIATEGNLSARGRDKDEAASALLELKLNTPVSNVSEQTIQNKVDLNQRLDAQVSRLLCVQLKHATAAGMTHVAYYSDNPSLQGYGMNDSQAKLALFSAQKQKQK
jgi:hypothetical protein